MNAQNRTLDTGNPFEDAPVIHRYTRHGLPSNRPGPSTDGPPSHSSRTDRMADIWRVLAAVDTLPTVGAPYIANVVNPFDTTPPGSLNEWRYRFYEDASMQIWVLPSCTVPIWPRSFLRRDAVVIEAVRKPSFGPIRGVQVACSCKCSVGFARSSKTLRFPMTLQAAVAFLYAGEEE